MLQETNCTFMLKIPSRDALYCEFTTEKYLADHKFVNGSRVRINRPPPLVPNYELSFDIRAGVVINFRRNLVICARKREKCRVSVPRLIHLFRYLTTWLPKHKGALKTVLRSFFSLSYLYSFIFWKNILKERR